MANLKVKHPEVAVHFKNGKCTVQRTNKVFSSMAIDQAHEQHNAVVKGDGGAIGLTQNPTSLQRWMLAGPELCRLISEFEDARDPDSAAKGDTHHHEQTCNIQQTFVRQVTDLDEVLDTMGNPFDDESRDLFILDTKEVPDQSVVDAVRNVEVIMKQQYNIHL